MLPVLSLARTPWLSLMRLQIFFGSFVILCETCKERKKERKKERTSEREKERKKEREGYKKREKYVPHASLKKIRKKGDDEKPYDKPRKETQRHSYMII